MVGTPRRYPDPVSGSFHRNPVESSSVETWGPAPSVQDEELQRVMSEVQSDMHGLVDEVVWGPLTQIRRDAHDFLVNLRTAFLRSHRRLDVHVRAEGGTEFKNRVRTELAELADAFRLVVLSRASMATHEAWSPAELSDAMGRALINHPETMVARVESETYRRRQGDLTIGLLQLTVLHADRWIRKVSRDDPPRRDVPFRDFLAWHIHQAEIEGLEGLSVLLVQAEAHLESRARSLFELVGRTLEALVVEPDELTESLARLRRQVEEELVLAEKEHGRFIDDLEARSRTVLAEALRNAKEELLDIGTFRLRRWQRRGAVARSERDRFVEDLLSRLESVRSTACGGYVLLGLRLELAAFRIRVTDVLEAEIADLERGVRGRSLKQIERLRTELAHAAGVTAQANEDPEDQLEATVTTPAASLELPAPAVEQGAAPELEKVLEGLQRVLRDAQRSAQQLVDQLTSEQALNGPLEEVAREARALTNKYRVPVHRVPHTEWTLPAEIPEVEVPFSAAVATFLETDIAPELLDTAAKAAASLQPMLAVFAEVERVVDLGGGQLDGDDAFVRDAPELGETRFVLNTAFERVRDQLQALEKPADGWSKELARNLRAAARSRLEALEERFGEGVLADAADLARPSRDLAGRPAHQLRDQLERLGGTIEGFRVKSTRRVRVAVGEGRIANMRRALGIPLAEEVDEGSVSPFEPPVVHAAVPPFYRRLFAGQATWAGDALEEYEPGIPAARRLLAAPSEGRLRAVAVIGAEGSGRRALVSALTRSERLGTIRRLSFGEPVGPSQVRQAMSELGTGQVVVITGAAWLASAAPGGFGALRALADEVLADEGRNAFVIEADRLVWQWASSVAPLEEVFGAQIRVPRLRATHLEKALMSRHRLSGLDLRIDSPDAEDGDRQRLFQALYRASDGLLQVALAYWIASLERVDERDGVVRVGAVPPSPHDALRSLPELTLHALYVVGRQGWMTPEILALLLGRRESEAAATLARLLSLGLVERISHGVYVIRRHLGGALQAVLQERGWI